MDEQGQSTKEMCEDCGLLHPSCGFAVEGKMRWCGGYAKRHEAVPV